MILPIPHLSTICSPSTFRIPSAPPRSQNMPVSAAGRSEQGIRSHDRGYLVSPYPAGVFCLFILPPYSVFKVHISAHTRCAFSRCGVICAAIPAFHGLSQKSL